MRLSFAFPLALVAVAAFGQALLSSGCTPPAVPQSPPPAVCRPDCDPSACEEGRHCILCDAQVRIVDLECNDVGPACGAVRWSCAH